MCVCDFRLLRKSGGHWVGHHGLWRLLGGLRGVKGERRVVHSVLGRCLVTLEWLVLEVLVSESIRVSPTVVTVATVVTATTIAFVVITAPAVTAVLCFGAAIVTPVTISIPIATKISPTPTGIAVPTVVLVVSSPTSGTTCRGTELATICYTATLTVVLDFI